MNENGRFAGSTHSGDPFFAWQIIRAPTIAEQADFRSQLSRQGVEACFAEAGFGSTFRKRDKRDSERRAPMQSERGGASPYDDATIVFCPFLLQIG
jgi:hypothetical protein